MLLTLFCIVPLLLITRRYWRIGAVIFRNEIIFFEYSVWSAVAWILRFLLKHSYSVVNSPLFYVLSNDNDSDCHRSFFSLSHGKYLNLRLLICHLEVLLFTVRLVFTGVS
jgi:hypothetical protein